jgi:outer membrane protein assembly factor BamB
VKRVVVLLLLGLTACSHATAGPSRCVAGDDALSTPIAATWTLPLERGPGAAAVDDAGAVVTMPERGLLAVDDRGTERWTVDVPGVGLDWPVIDGDLVIVPTSDEKGAGCVAIGRARGEIRWRVDAGPGAGAVAAIDRDAVLCATAEGRIVAVDRVGTTRWSTDVAAAVGGPVAISGRSVLAVDDVAHRVGFVFRAGGGWMLGCLDLGTGRDATCSRELGTGAPPSAVVSDGAGRFVVGSGDGPGIVVEDAATGDRASLTETADAFDPANIPAVTGGVAIAVDRSGQVTAVDIGDPRIVWRAEVGRPVLDARPAVGGGVVSIVDWTGRIHRLRVADGHPQGAADERGGAIAVASDPAGRLRVTVFRGAAGARVEGEQGVGSPSGRRLHCPAEPGHSSRNDARP